jgi:hypothetical protein
LTLKTASAILSWCTEGSSSGRTTGSGPVNQGSNPCPSAKSVQELAGFACKLFSFLCRRGNVKTNVPQRLIPPPAGWARNIGNFARFLESISLSHGTVLNVSNVAREYQIERKTAAGYVEIIEDLLLGFRVPISTRRAKRQTTAHPKFYNTTRVRPEDLGGRVSA